jgi:proline-specific peptidase
MDDTGFVAVTGGNIWYRRLGEGPATPVLMLHGGPGAGHDYLEPLAERLAAHRPVVVYDQLGCGRSDAPDDPSLWTVDRSVEELDQVRRALGMGRTHLFGQSWGGWLAIEYMCRRPEGIVALVLASTSASIPQFMAEARGLIEAMPEPARGTLLDLGDRGEYDHPDYQAAVMEFYRRHLCRLDPWPDAFQRSADQMDGNQVYLVMNGPTEFDVIGRLREWDRTADLARITVPTLITCGLHDEITPACSQTIQAGIPGSMLEIFEHSSHVAHLEEGERYAEVMERFLAGVEARLSRVEEAT